ncbi:hypothetical protein ACFYYR_16970 [Streptomyces sp. NPDC001922]|uniref:hypothetical protein n=1 Tax=Streptomyces sp. NPDC001922 TaxID=3364624 RepID=UPI0036962ACC
MDFIHPDDTVARTTLDWIAERFSTDDFGAPDITHAHVPLGEAVRPTELRRRRQRTGQ